MNKRQYWYLPPFIFLIFIAESITDVPFLPHLFIKETVKAQSFKDVKQLAQSHTWKCQEWDFNTISESTVQVLGIEHGLLGTLLLSIFLQHPVDGTSAACLWGL